MPDRPNHYVNQTVYLVHLSDKGAPIEDYLFENCRINGPAVVLAEDTLIEGAGFWGDVDGALWPLPGGRYIQGTLRLRRCVFRQCTFQGIGFTGQNLLEIRDQIERYFNNTWPGEGT